MWNWIIFILVAAVLGLSVISIALPNMLRNAKENDENEHFENVSYAEANIFKTEREWRTPLNENQYRILRLKDKESANFGQLIHPNKKLVYKCAGCGNAVFGPDTNYESGTGWTAFWAPLSREAIKFAEDPRTSPAKIGVLCGNCGAHLGHVFPDGPDPTGLRYKIKSSALDFAEKEV